MKKIKAIHAKTSQFKTTYSSATEASNKDQSDSKAATEYSETNFSQPAADSAPPVARQVLTLQRMVGNQAVMRLLAQKKPKLAPTSHQGPAPAIQRKLQGTSTVLQAAQPRGVNLSGRQWKKLKDDLAHYEQLEVQQTTTLASIKQKAQAAPVQFGQQRPSPMMIGSRQPPSLGDELIALRKQRDTGFANLAQLLDSIIAQALQLISEKNTPPEIKQTLETLMPRFNAEKADLKYGRFEKTEGFGDYNMNGPAQDNAVGGALNKLDKVKYGETKAFYKPEIIKDPKYDHHGGTPSGIPEVNPNFGGRSVAMYRIDQLLNTNLIVKTEFATHTRQALDKEGNPMGPGPLATTGIMMEKALDAQSGVEMRKGIIEGSGVAYSAEEKAKLAAQGQVKLDINDPVLQRSLNKLQILDALCAQVDRHNANFYISQDAQGKVTGVKGIDNDLAFGKDLKDPSSFFKAPAFKRLPPLVDAELGETILKLNPQDVRMTLEGLLTNDEVEATLDRLKVLQDHLKALKAAKQFLQPAQWNAETAQMQNKDNSYLGEVKSESLGPVDAAIKKIIDDMGVDPDYSKKLKNPIMTLIETGKLGVSEAKQIAKAAALTFNEQVTPLQLEANERRAEFRKKQETLQDPNLLQAEMSKMTKFNGAFGERIDTLAKQSIAMYIY